MAITVGGLTIRALQEFPYGHAGDSLNGRTARRWPVKAIMRPSEWLALENIYLTWRAARIAEPDTMVSLSVGTTVTTSGKAYGLTWSNVPAWFTSPPAAAAAGGMLSVSFELIDAAQQLAVLTRSDEIAQQLQDNESTYGTYSIAGLTLNLTAAVEAYQDGPRMELAATGTHVIRGPLMATRLRKVQGWTHATNAGATIRTWYEQQIAATPAVGSWWPVSPPTTEQTPVIVAGARVTRHLMTLELGQV